MSKSTQASSILDKTMHMLKSLPAREKACSEEIFTEMVESYADLHHIQHGVTIYGSARVPEDAPLYAETVRLGTLLAQSGYHVITGGGPGIMAAGNQGAHEAGKANTGLRIRLPHEQHANGYMSKICYFNNFMTRKHMFMTHSKAYVVMPGGLGTLDELSEIFVLVQTSKVPPAPIILYSSAFWQPFIAWLQNSVAHGGFMLAEDVNLLHVVDTPEEAVAVVQRFIPLHGEC